MFKHQRTSKKLSKDHCDGSPLFIPLFMPDPFQARNPGYPKTYPPVCQFWLSFLFFPASSLAPSFPQFHESPHVSMSESSQQSLCKSWNFSTSKGLTVGGCVFAPFGLRLEGATRNYYLAERISNLFWRGNVLQITHALQVLPCLFQNLSSKTNPMGQNFSGTDAHLKIPSLSVA